jgi:hypothetical protein
LFSLVLRFLCCIISGKQWDYFFDSLGNWYIIYALCRAFIALGACLEFFLPGQGLPGHVYVSVSVGIHVGAHQSGICTLWGQPEDISAEPAVGIQSKLHIVIS